MGSRLFDSGGFFWDWDEGDYIDFLDFAIKNHNDLATMQSLFS
jgi:hypothetical protein